MSGEAPLKLVCRDVAFLSAPSVKLVDLPGMLRRLSGRGSGRGGGLSAVDARRAGLLLYLHTRTQRAPTVTPI